MKRIFKRLFRKSPVKSDKEVVSEFTAEAESTADVVEETNDEVEEVILPKLRTVSEYRGDILREFPIAEKRLADIVKQYYILKLFSRAAVKNPSFNEQIFNLDREINYIKKLFTEINRKMDIVKYMQDVTSEELAIIYDNLANFFTRQSDIANVMRIIERTFYKNIKMASAGIIINKNNLELESFHRAVNDFMSDFKSLQEAAEYVYFHSGDLIKTTVNTLVKSVENSRNKEHVKTYNYDFFLSATEVLTLELTEWVDLFNKIRFVVRVVSDINIINYVEFKNNFTKLEIRYFILMLYMESTSQDDLKGISKFNI